ncbi:MAG: TerB family tellurite resistance protein, partial [Deltaproteobacteria bacterium]|nr:TerB family tellurite resistance protein [Deltaproteobacteria bacterium]
MLNFIKKTLLQADQGGAEGSAPAEERTRIAAIVILLEAAHADHECSEEEMEHIIETVRDQYGLSEEEAGELLELAHRERSRAVDLFEFTSHINDAFNKNEKIAVLETVWRIIYIDWHL